MHRRFHGLLYIVSGVICPESYDLRNGLIQYSSRTYMAEASVLCNEGYIYSKPEAHVIKCQGDNTWSAAEGTCEGVRFLLFCTVLFTLALTE